MRNLAKPPTCFFNSASHNAMNTFSLRAHYKVVQSHAYSAKHLPSIFLSYSHFWRRQWHPTLVLLPGKSHGWRSLEGCNPWGHWGSDMTERLHFYFSLSCIGEGNGNPLQCSCLENPRTGEPGGLPSVGSHRVGHDWGDLAVAVAAVSSETLLNGRISLYNFSGPLMSGAVVKWLWMK